MQGWLAPVRTEHALRVRVLLAVAGAAACVVGSQLLVIGLGTLASVLLGPPLSVGGFLALSFGLALLAQGLMPWETPGTAPSLHEQR